MAWDRDQLQPWVDAAYIYSMGVLALATVVLLAVEVWRSLHGGRLGDRRVIGALGAIIAGAFAIRWWIRRWFRRNWPI
jgi:hypothetical protein